MFQDAYPSCVFLSTVGSACRRLCCQQNNFFQTVMGAPKGGYFVCLSSGKERDSSTKLTDGRTDFFFLVFSLPVQLLHKLSVRAADGPQKLLKVNIL